MPLPQIARQQDGHGITPFWNRIPQFFLFPFKMDMLVVLAPLAMASLLVYVVPLPRALSYLLVEGGIWLSAFRHSFGVTLYTSQGLLSPEEYSYREADPERANLPWKLLGVVIAWGLILGLLASLGAFVRFVGTLMFTVAFPACVMVLTISNSGGTAMNPAEWWRVIRGVGKSYLALFVFLLLLSSGAMIVLPLLAPLLRSWLAMPVVNFVFLYFNLIMFNMMGYVLYQYHEELDIDVEVSFAEIAAAAPGAAPVDLVGEEIALRIAEGDMEGALDLAYEQQRLDVENISAQERYFKLLIVAGKKDRALSHGQGFIRLLLRKVRADQALDVFKRLRELDEALLPEDGNTVLPLAEAAYRRHDYPLALSIMRSFDKRHPRNADVPGVYLLSARILGENLKKDDLAMAILRGLKTKFPDHPLAAEADSHLQVFERLRQMAPMKAS